MIESSQHSHINPAQTSLTSIKDELINVLTLEASTINHVITHFPNNAEQLVKKIIATKGKVILTGSGKSGHVAKKLTATFASLGIPSVFLHPHDALHGDLGVVHGQDFVIILSKSGSGTEFEYMIPFFKSQNTDHVLICCDRGPLASKANITVTLPFQREACALNLAPTSSSTLMMAFGDALAIVVSKLKTFGPNDFARFHPAGALGKKLKHTVKNFMHVGTALPLVLPTEPIQKVITVANEKKLGLCIIADTQNNLLGIISDGDIRRACSHGPELFKLQAQNIMTTKPKVISPETPAGQALSFMEDFNITSLIVTQDKHVVGLIHIHDIVKAGLRG